MFRKTNEFNYIKVAAASPRVYVGNPEKNKEIITDIIYKAIDKQIGILVFPELCITGYTCGDLFNQKSLLDAALYATYEISRVVSEDILVYVGLPYEHNGVLYNVAAALNNKQVVGLIPKKYIPNYKEFYEYRWFHGWGKDFEATNYSPINQCNIGNLILDNDGIKVGAEICEDLWVPVPPSSILSLNGTQIIANLSASNELIGKAEYRRELVKNQSGRCICAYIYASAGPTESTTDLVFGGHSIIAENGTILAESERFEESGFISATIDLDKLTSERVKNRSFAQQADLFHNKYFTQNVSFQYGIWSVNYPKVSPTPFIPSDTEKLNERCQEIINIQISSLKKRLIDNNIKKLHIGVSGGLDSTLALLIGKTAFEQLNRDTKDICGYSLPGFGTSEGTKNNASKLMEACGITQKTIDIKNACFDTFKSIGHNPFGINISLVKDVDELQSKILEVPKEKLHDPVFENVQARMRTLILMSNGFVLGTGDLSELALGWCTYNADHMSMYNPNCSIPKTLVRFLVEWFCNQNCPGLWSTKTNELFNVLTSILNTEISPELLPISDGKIQSTEDIIGAYEIHDFILFYMLRYGFAPTKIYKLALQAFKNNNKITAIANTMFKGEVVALNKYIKKTFISFYTRFFSNQFKRSCVPDGPKVGSISLSPRGDWRMPSDANAELWLKEANNLECPHWNLGE